MSKEPKRACGYRKVGGIYLMAPGPGEPCHRLPWALDVCPACGGGIKQSRGWTWVDGFALFSPGCAMHNERALLLPTIEAPEHCARCAVCTPRRLGRCGLLWIGERFYPTPEHFDRESVALGISKRIAAIPQGFEAGKTWVLLAHPLGIAPSQEHPEGMAAVFRVFMPTHIEQIVTETQSRDEVFMAGLRKRGITPVPVPDDDPDHQGSVYDPAQGEILDETPDTPDRPAAKPAKRRRTTH